QNRGLPMKYFFMIAAIGVLAVASGEQDREKLDRIQQALKDDVPRILCIDERVATGGQPTDAGFAKLASNGYRAVLNLRTAQEGVDLEREKQLVEGAGMRYISIPVGSAPKPEQADEFIKAAKEPANQPMLIHCGSANRVGAFWMIYRVVEQGWPEDKALEEATQIGLRSAELKRFAQEYIAANRTKKTGSD
ncbi:MAG TPA: protein tyrosine phosphatase family protein, partial [Blastocatellia bacterium]|nr:protein tyrosine phosphatase family protein [Blastocatellia bacterium]